MCNISISACSRIAFSRRPYLRVLLPVLLLFAFALTREARAASLGTTTTLTLSSSSVASPAEVTLTASVTGGGSPLEGTVTFCNASAALCEDAAILGKAQLVGGTAILKIIPGIGSHTYKAVFGATATAAGSTSGTQTLTVTGLYPTTTTLTASGNANGYALTATVVGSAVEPPVLAGSVTFQDITDNTKLLGTVTLSQPPTFAQSYVPAPGSPVQTGNSPAVAGVGDFNEDGKPDLAVVNAGDDTISILLGNGDGTFTLFATLPAIGTAPCASTAIQSNCAIVVGDFNDDGHADLAATSGNDDTVTILEGNGQGSFTPFSGSPIAVGSYPEAVKIGDFNNDGILDLVVANSGDDTLSILLGNGDGTFTPASGSPTSAGVGDFPFFIAVADFNGDGNADLAVVNGRDNSLSLLEGNGDGTFTPFNGSPYIFPNAAGSCPVVAADFNGDGKIDLAVANFMAGQPNGTVYILLGNGDGTFTTSSQTPITVGLNPFSMVSLDYNGDGYTDLAIANFSFGDPTGTLTLLLGQGNGLFQPPGAPITLGSQPNDVVTADFNGDGLPDLATPDSGDTTTTILLNTVTQTATATLQNVILDGPGTHVVKGTYPANTDFAGSFGTIDLQGLSVPTSLTLSANPTAQLVTLPVTFTTQLNAPAAPQGPTGTVSFFDAGVLLGTVAIDATGQAAYTTSGLADGVHSITASYTGDAIYQGIASSALSITISDLQVSRVGKNNTTILPGTTVVYTLQVAPMVASSFLYNVTPSASGLPDGATATFSPAAVTAGSNTTTVTMTIETSKTALNTPPRSPYERLPLVLGLLLPLFGVSRVRRRLRHIPRALGVLLLVSLSLTAVGGLSGCSGAGLFAARKVPYSITVTVSEGNASGTLQRSTSVPLAIQ